MDSFFIIITILSTVVVYILTKRVYQKFPRPYTLPILLSTIMIIIGLLTLNISYETYYHGAHWIDRFLGPAVVALAYPLYQQREILKKHAVNVLISVSVGSVIGVFSGWMMGMMLGYGRSIISSLLPKSVTTPVAVDIAQSIGGSAPLAAILVMIAGISGAAVGPSLLSLLRVDNHLARGLGMGSASHAIGTARAMESNSQEGAASTIAMVLCSVIVSMVTPILVFLLF
jgi:predicted murein hydrolase (TIGR00659 family)